MDHADVVQGIAELRYFADFLGQLGGLQVGFQSALVLARGSVAAADVA